MCNPKKNVYTSPVDIFSANAEHVREMETLMVHSKKPPKGIYAFSTTYDMDNVRMESFNIKSRDEVMLRKATHISGMSSSTERFFKSALIMFRPGPDQVDEPLNEHQSLHNVDEKEYPMEIMLNFQAHSEKTQIHVMVQVEEEENAVWKPILDSFSDLLHTAIKQVCFGDKRIQQVQENFNSSNTSLNEVLLEEQKETKGLTYKRIIAELGKVLEDLRGVTNETIANLSKSQLDALVHQHSCKQELIGTTTKLEKLEADKAQISTANNTSLYHNLIAMNVNAEINALRDKIPGLETCVRINGAKADALQKGWSKQVALMKQNRIGNEPTDLFTSVDDVAVLLNKTKDKQSVLEKIKLSYEKALLELENVNSLSDNSVTLKDPFQISWLFPPYGGFYFYNGSSPTPPCDRRSDVIVLEDPITIGLEQLKQFRDFPSLIQQNSTKIAELCLLNEQGKRDDSDEVIKVLTEMQKIKLQVPPISSLGNRTLWFNPKNIQFLDDDGIHMKSTLRRRMKMKDDEEESLALADVRKGNVATVWMLFVVILSVA